MDSYVSLIVCVLVYFGTFTHGATTNDPCFSYKSLNDSTRLISYKLKSGESEKSDRLLDSGWYKNTHNSDGELMTTCPNMTDCGTNFPVWINVSFIRLCDGRPDKTKTICLPIIKARNIYYVKTRTLPGNGKIETVTACKHTARGCCGSSFPIKVKRCDGLFVYELQSMPTSTGRYCFNGPRKCGPGETSPTGFAPCTASHLHFTATLTVVPEINDALQQLTFKCNGVSRTYRSLFFDVVWEVNGKEVNRSTDLTYSSLINSRGLIEKEWNVTGVRIGMNVRCGIRARNYRGGPTTVFRYSPTFFAGFQVRDSSIKVQSGVSAKIWIRSTVPMVCNVTNCEIRLEVFDFQEQLQSTSQCNRNLTRMNLKKVATVVYPSNLPSRNFTSLWISTCQPTNNIAHSTLPCETSGCSK